ncbi:MAG: hypothetical protein LBN02_04880 [Oscillospiraceae bacterium]|jgi:amino acid transporter|nr:hypothetical protein [Oscillospiraceae bacterium]
MLCPDCGSDNDKREMFCNICGYSLQSVRPQRNGKTEKYFGVFAIILSINFAFCGFVEYYSGIDSLDGGIRNYDTKSVVASFVIAGAFAILGIILLVLSRRRQSARPQRNGKTAKYFGIFAIILSIYFAFNGFVEYYSSMDYDDIIRSYYTENFVISLAIAGALAILGIVLLIISRRRRIRKG